MRYAKVKDGKIVNVVSAGPAWAAEHGLILVPGEMQIGDLWDGTNFSKAPRDLDAERVLFFAELRRLLRSTDWTQLQDGLVGPEKAAWAQYRAALRVALKNPTIDPQTFVWPEAPGEFDES